MDILKKIIVIASFLAALMILMRVLFLGTYPDFDVYYAGSLRLFEGQNPYVVPRESINYVYPPFTLLFFAPLTLFPLFLASKIWTILSLLFLFASLLLLSRILSMKITSSVFVMITIFSMLSFPVKFTLGMGQINLFILLLVLLGVYFLLSKKNVVSGVFFGTAITLKFFPLLILPYFLLKKKWRVLFYSFVTIASFWLVSVLFVGWELQLYYVKNVLPGILNASQAAYYNQALSGFLVRIFGNTSLFDIGKLIITCVLLVISFLVIFKRKRKENAIFEISIIITLSLIVNSFSWQHHFVWLILPFAVAFREVTKKGWVEKITLLIAFFLVAINIKNPGSLPTIAQSHVFFGTFLLWVLLLHLLIKKQHA